jgi:hypothetical protein
MKFNDRRGESFQVSKNLTVKSPKNTPFKPELMTGARQALYQNISAMPFEPSASEAEANARGLKAANKPKKVPMENVSKTATRIFGVPTTSGKPKMVVPGSKKANKLQAKSDWSDSYEKKANAKFDARMKKMKGK